MDSIDNINIKLPYWIEPLFDRKMRTTVLHGGRGSGKSWAIADFLILMSASKQVNILCCREVQDSLDDSVYAMIKGRVIDHGLEDDYLFLKDGIYNITTGSQFKFKGIGRNPEKIKSVFEIDYLWIEEGESISAYSWRVVAPSIRADDSQIIISLNPKHPEDIIYNDYINCETPPHCYVKELNWRDNPHFPEVLKVQREQDLRLGEDLYNWIWEGKLLEHSDTQIFKGHWEVKDFDEPEAYKIECKYGLDFGFKDPSAAVRCYVYEEYLYVTHEFYQTNVLPTELGRYCERIIPKFNTSMVVCDSARPDAIAQLKSQGYYVKASKKGKGSVMDGIDHLKSFKKIIVHPRCKCLIDEFKNYSYKKDKRSDKITNVIDDAAGYDHLIDALRYALEDMMKSKYVDYSKFNIDRPLY